MKVQIVATTSLERATAQRDRVKKEIETDDSEDNHLALRTAEWIIKVIEDHKNKKESYCGRHETIPG